MSNGKMTHLIKITAYGLSILVISSLLIVWVLGLLLKNTGMGIVVGLLIALMLIWGTRSARRKTY